MVSAKEVGKFIQNLRKEKNMTQSELASLLDVTNKAVSRWETGEGYPDITIMPKLAETLNVSTDELLSAQKKQKDEVVSNKIAKGKFLSITLIDICLVISAQIIGIVNIINEASSGIGIIISLSLLAIVIFLVGKYRFINETLYNESEKNLVFILTCVFIISLLTILLFYFTWFMTPVDVIQDSDLRRFYFNYLLSIRAPYFFTTCLIIINVYFRIFYRKNEKIFDLLTLALPFLLTGFIYLIYYIIDDPSFKRQSYAVALTYQALVVSGILIASYLIYITLQLIFRKMSNLKKQIFFSIITVLFILGLLVAFIYLNAVIFY